MRTSSAVAQTGRDPRHRGPELVAGFGGPAHCEGVLGEGCAGIHVAGVRPEQLNQARVPVRADLFSRRPDRDPGGESDQYGVDGAPVVVARLGRSGDAGGVLVERDADELVIEVDVLDEGDSACILPGADVLARRTDGAVDRVAVAGKVVAGDGRSETVTGFGRSRDVGRLLGDPLVGRATVESGLHRDRAGVALTGDISARDPDGKGEGVRARRAALSDVLHSIDGDPNWSPAAASRPKLSVVYVPAGRVAASPAAPPHRTWTMPASACPATSWPGVPATTSVYPSQSRSATASALANRSPACGRSDTSARPCHSTSLAPSPTSPSPSP